MENEYKVVHEGKTYFMCGKDRNDIVSKFSKMKNRTIRDVREGIRISKIKKKNIYFIVENGKVIFNGTLKEVANFLGYAENSIERLCVYCQSNKEYRVKKKYVLVKNKHILDVLK